MGDFTRDAENVIQQAKEEARHRYSPYVDDVDILLALTRRAEPLIFDLLNRNAIDYYKIRQEVGKNYNQNIPCCEAPWTISAQSVLNNAREMANGDCCETKYLFVGLLKTNSTAKKILYNLGFRFCPEDILSQFSIIDCKQQIRTHIRWMIRRDMPEVLAIEAASFEFPWLEDDFIRCLRQQNCIGMVAEHDDRVVGFMIYELNKNRIQILNFAVLPEMRRHGVGTQMARKLISKLSARRRTHLLLEVRETNLMAQLFFRQCGLRAISVLRDHYEDAPEDAYLMQYRCPSEESEEYQPVNRVTRLAD
jgi:ribosomal-protein-alanine N-acetyltransferase